MTNNNSEIDKLKEGYVEELKRKDKIIEELKKENQLILKSALKQSKKVEELKSKI